MTTQITASNLTPSFLASIDVPKITVLAYPGDDQAADPAGGQTITLTGTGFVTGCTVFTGSTQVGTVTFISETSITFISLALASATYTVYVINPDGGTAALVPGISYSGLPNWTTTAGSIASVYEYSSISSTVTATGDAPVSYALYSGSLPSGSSLNTSTGLISGTSIASAGATTSSFVIRATDGQLQDSDRSFSITVNTDVVTWVSPANNSTVTLPLNSASSTALSATSAAGKSITYTANALPTGLSIVSSAVTGTPTVTANTTSLFTATAATDGKTTTATINWVVSVASDPYFNSVVLLLSASTPTSNFIADASVNTFAIAPGGTPSANTNNPIQPGYYSGYFPGSSYLTVGSSTVLNFGTSDFTIETWAYFNDVTSPAFIFDGRPASTNGAYPLINVSSGTLAYNVSGSNQITTTVVTNQWYHIAVSRLSGSTKLYINGNNVGSTYNDSTSYASTSNRPIIGNSDGTSYINGYLSNFRVVKGVAVYTGAFTPPTAPLAATQTSGTNIAAITGTATSLLTLQSNRFIDNSTYQATLTPTGTPNISVTQPFTLPSPYTGYGSGLFNGTTGYLQSPSNVALTLGTSDFTIEAWVYLTVAGSASVIGPVWDGRPSVNGAYPYLLVQGNTTNYNVAWYVNATNQVTAPTLALNTWHHIAYSRSYATAGRLFVNGALIQSWVDNVNYLGSQGRIGSNYDASGLLGGYISNLRITKGTAVYTGAFTPPTLAPLTNAGSTSAASYPSTTNVDITFASSATSLLTLQNNQAQNNNQFRDSSTNNFAVTRTGTPTQGTFTPFSQTGWSGLFAGASTYLTPSNIPIASTGAFTIELWMYPTSSALQCIYSQYLSAGADPGRMNMVFNDAAVGKITISTGTSAGTGSLTSTSSISLNTWTHFALVRDGSNVAKMYINGVLDATNATFTTTILQTTAIIGYTAASPGFGFYGYISNFRITNTAVYTGNFTVPTAPLQATQSAGTNIAAITGTATSLLTLQSNLFKDNSTNNFAITPSGTPSIQAFSPFAPTTTYSAATVGGSVYFDGSNYVSVPKSTALEPATSGAWTIEFFCYTGSTSAQNPWTYGNATISSGPDLGTYFSVTGNSSVTGGFYSSTQPTTITGGNVILNQWNHIALVSTGTMMTLYLNGLSVGTPVNISGVSINAPSSATGRIGVYAGSSYFNGYISNFRFVKGTAVYTGAFTPPTAPLTATQTSGTNIAAITSGTSLLMSATNSGIYDSTGKNDLTTVGDARTSTAVIKYGSSSMYFDGTGDYLNCGYSPQFDFGTGDFTVECWVYTTSYATAQGLFESRVQADVVEANRLMLSILVTSGYPQLYNASNDVAVISTIAIPLNTWTHVAFTRNSGTARVFVNGQVGATNVSFTTNFLVNKLIIGAMIQSSGGGVYNRNFFNGYIDDYRITKGIARYTTTFTPPTAPFALQ